MPQRIDKIVPDPHCKLDVNALIEKPKLAILVTQIFALWASIEQDLDVLLVNVLGANATPALAMFATLTAQHLQLGALEAAAKAALPKDDFDIFKAALLAVDCAQTPRNHLAHWSWGVCLQRPDLLILANPKMLSARDLRVAKLLHAPGPKAEPKEIGEANLFDDSEILAYSEADLSRAVRDLQEAIDILRLMTNYIDPSWAVYMGPSVGVTLTQDEIRARIIERLSGLRLFCEAMARIRGSA